MGYRHLDYPQDTPVVELGPAALDDLLDRGDLDAWAPLARAVLADPAGEVADTVLELCAAHPMNGTSEMWRTWISRLRSREEAVAGVSLGELRRRRGLSQQIVAQRLGISQSDVSKLERRADVRISSLRAFVAAVGGELSLVVSSPSGKAAVTLRLSERARAQRPTPNAPEVP